MITHKEYMADSSNLHHDYHIQFATDRTRHLVANVIGKDRIIASTDYWLNDIPLKQWDDMAPRIKDTIDRRLLGAAQGQEPGKFLWSLSDACCIAKAVAREIRKAAQ